MASGDHIGFFLGFGRALRAEGLQIGSAEIELFMKGLAKAEVKSLRDIYWAGRVCATASPEQIPVYDRVFQHWFQNMGDATFPAALALHQEESCPSISKLRTPCINVARRSSSRR